MIKTDIQKERRQRFDGYIQFSISDSFISYITVEDQRLYFPKYDSTCTIADLNQQYSKIHQGKQLNLQTDQFKIDPTTPLDQITSTSQKIVVLQKVLTSCKEHKDPLKDIQKPEQKKLAEQLVSFVKKHKEKIQGIKDFQSHDCLIIVKQRPECKAEFNYFLQQGTTMNVIAEFINQKAGNFVQLLSIQAESGVTYAGNLLNKPFSELKMNSKQLTFNYPYILTLNKTAKFKIKLTNSPYPHQVIQLGVKKQDTIQVLIKAIKKITEVTDDPLQIRDSQGNSIEVIKWVNPLSSFIYRKLQFQFLYPTFLSYQCEIHVSNFSGKIYKLNYLVHKTTTFNHMIQYVRENIYCQNANFRIIDSKGKSYKPQLRTKTLFSMKIEEQVFRFVYVKPTCLITGKTKVIVKCSEEGKLQQIAVKELSQSEKLKQLQIMTYNEQKHEMEFGRVTCIKKESGYSRLLQVTLAGDADIVHIQCFADSTFKTQHFVWKPARMLCKGEKIMMLSSDFQTIHYAEVLSLKQIGIESDQQLYTLQVQPHHNFLANGIILHNDESYTFKVHFYQKSKPPRKQSLKCYLHEKLCEVPAFKNKRLMMGGLQLKNNLTFGDYQIYNFGTIIAFEQNYYQSCKNLIISAWREQTYQQDQIDQLLRDKWSTDFWGLRLQKIVEIKKDLQTMKNANYPEQLLVCPKIQLKKLNYVYNIAPQHKSNEQRMMQNHFKPMILGSQGYKLRYQQLIEQKDDFLRSDMDILPIYLYTTNLVFSSLNKFLRLPEHSKCSVQEIQQWYSLTNRLVNSLEKLPSVEYTTLYRGMNNISISDAFGLASKNASKTKDQDKYLILDSFTSTTKDKQVALAFITGKGALMTIKSHSGKCIQNYSQYPDQGQVLLPPFLYFKITKFKDNTQGVQEIELQQIPFPRTDRKKLVYWVDDIPAGNRCIIENQFQPNGIEVVQVMSTSIMKIILRDFFGILQAIGKQIVIISDMGRYEDGAWNCEAGVDLFNLIYKEYGMSNKAIIFTMDQKRARNAIMQRGINQSNWTVLVDSDKVVTQVMAEFNK